MTEKVIIVTNNPISNEALNQKYEVEYMENIVQLEVLKRVRDYIHNGHHLLSHPLVSSIKPNEVPYRTIVITKEKKALDMYSLEIIENSIHSTEKFLKDFGLPNWSDSILDDFKVIDYDLIQHAL